MTNDEMIELSKRVAEKYAISAYRDGMAHSYDKDGVLRGQRIHTFWLGEDSGRIADLCVKARLSCLISEDCSQVEVYDAMDTFECVEFSANHNGDELQAWRIAALRALDAKG